jgi:hypothetical protein
MGGYGSGRRSDRPSTDECLRLSLSQFKARGMLKRGCMGRREFVWSSDGEVMARATVTVDIDCLEPYPQISIMGYRLGRAIDCRLQLVSTPMRFGGERWYAVCPITCRRCTTLVLPPGRSRFASVQGWGVAYGSQREAPIYRAYRAVEKIDRRLLGMSKYSRKPSRARVQRRLSEKQQLIELEFRRLASSICG